MANVGSMVMHRQMIVIYIMTGVISAEIIPTFGPMIHWNIGAGKKVVAYSFELALWEMDELSRPMSIDMGIEGDLTNMEMKKIRFYFEFQTHLFEPAWHYTGISFGPVVEAGKNKNGLLGFQASAWAACLVGADVRYRWIGRTSYVCPGTFLKLWTLTSRQ